MNRGQVAQSQRVLSEGETGKRTSEYLIPIKYWKGLPYIRTDLAVYHIEYD